MRSILPKILVAISFLAITVEEGVAAFGSLSVSATVLSKSNCKFSTPTGDLIFGTIDSGGTADVSATATLTFRCNGSAPIATYLVSDNGGANANKMEHTTPGNFLPYELSYTPISGSVPRGDPVTLSITGTVRSSDYRAAMAGDYIDSVELLILP